MAILGTSTLDTFIPEIWSARLISNLNKTHVYAGLVNRDYEGEIANVGDTVHANTIGRVNILSYARNGALTAPQTITSTKNTLTITEANAFNFMVDDIDKAQTKGSVMEEAMKEAAYTLSEAVDTYISGMYTAATAGADLASANTTNKDKFYELMVDNRQKFRESNVPIDDLTAVIAPWMETNILKDARFIHATASGDNVLKNGEIGKLGGVNIVVSNNVTATNTGVDFHVMTFAGKQGITFADQINKTEAYRPETGFQDAVKGLHVWGAKVMRPAFVLTSTVSKA